MNERQVRVVSLLHEMIASFIAGESNTDPLITVTNINLSPDHRKATVFITTIPSGREADALIFLKRHASPMRRHIMKKSNLKIIPHLEFMLDAGERHRQHIDTIVQNLEEEKK